MKNSEDSKNSVLLDFSSWGKSDYTEKKVKCVGGAINDKNVIRFLCFNANGTYTARVIEPIHLLFKSTSWYVYGFCRVRNDYRLCELSHHLLTLNWGLLASCARIFSCFQDLEQSLYFHSKSNPFENSIIHHPLIEDG